jgi:hypothetical protein
VSISSPTLMARTGSRPREWSQARYAVEHFSNFDLAAAAHSCAVSAS